MLFNFRREKKTGRRHRGRKCDRGVNQYFTCVCPECGRELRHQSAAPCFQTKCPECRSPMARKFVVEG